MAGGYALGVLAEMLLLGTAVLGLDLLVGFGGVLSLGHAALFGSAAYAGAIAAGALGGNVLLVLVAGILAGAAMGGVLGLLTARASGLVTLVLTLLLSQAAVEVALHWRSVTGGPDGLRGLPPLSLGPVLLAGAEALAALSAGVAVAGYTVARRFVAAPTGQALLGTREQPLRMSALGYSVPRIRVTAALLSGAITGAAGALYPFVTLYAGPHLLGWGFSATLMIVLVLGGTASLWGGFAGSALYVALQTYVGAYTDRWQLLVGVAFVLAVSLLPQGLAGLARRRPA